MPKLSHISQQRQPPKNLGIQRFYLIFNTFLLTGNKLRLLSTISTKYYFRNIIIHKLQFNPSLLKT